MIKLLLLILLVYKSDIYILHPLACGFTKVLVYELFSSDFKVKQDGIKKVWQGSVTKKRFENF